MGAVKSLGTAFQKEVDRVAGAISNLQPNTYNIELIFVSSNETINVTLSREIESVSILQDFPHANTLQAVPHNMWRNSENQNS